MSGFDLQHYREHGYCLMRGFFRSDELAPLNDRFLQIALGKIKAPSEMLVMRDVMIVRGIVKPREPLAAIAKIQDFHQDPVLFEGYARHPRLLDVIEQITGPDIKCIHNMLINKPPGVDGRHPLHQDLLYFPFGPTDSIVASWTAIEATNRENGCLAIVPGSHRGELLKHGKPDIEWNNALYFGAEGVGPQTERLHLEMQPGDTVFFHPLLLHGSGRNRSDHYRRAISADFASAACRYTGAAIHAPPPRPYRMVRGREHADGI